MARVRSGGRQRRSTRAPPSTPEGSQARAVAFGAVAAKTDWNPVLRDELAKPYWSELQSFVAYERQRHQVYPPHDEVFAALHQTPFASVKVSRLPVTAIVAS